MTKIALPDDLEAWAREEVAGHQALVEQAYREVDAGLVLSEAEVDAELDSWIAEAS